MESDFRDESKQICNFKPPCEPGSPADSGWFLPSTLRFSFQKTVASELC